MPFRLRDCLPFAGRLAQSFRYLDPGPLIDEELELVCPSEQWIDPILAACRDPLSVEQAPSLAQTTRQQLTDFLRACPNGRQKANPADNIVPGYHFWMRVTNNPALPIAGGIGLRVGDNYDLAMFGGHIGYHVYPPARGHHYAERACRLLFPLARLHQINPLWITCNPDNLPSRRTCERLGGQLVEIVPIPMEHPLYRRGETEKCRYRIDLV